MELILFKEYRALPAAELGTAGSPVRLTVLLFKWASPRSFKVLIVKVAKSNWVVAKIEEEALRQHRKKKKVMKKGV